MFNKPLIYAVISILVIAIIYSPSATFGVQNRANSAGASCEQTGKHSANGLALVECCWLERVPPGTGYAGGDLELYCSECEDGGTRGKISCSEPELQFAVASPTPGPFVSPEDGVLEQPEQPLFGGRNEGGVPPTGGVEQPPAPIQPTPGGGADVPTEGGSAEQPTAPQNDQDDNQGGGLPTIKNQENIPPGGGVAEQPEDDEQEDSSEGAETAGPIT